jgi:hypothetical protein
MSTRTIAYIEGKPIRIDEGPARAGHTGYGGSLVVGVSATESQRDSQKKHKTRKAPTT